MELAPPNKSNSYPNKMTHKMSNTITFSVKLYNTFQRELDFEEFCEKFMEQWDEDEMRETDEAFDLRCKEAWEKLILHSTYDDEIELEDEEDSNGDGDAQLVDMSDECINDWISDDLVDKYDKIVLDRLNREKKERDLKKKNDDALAECVRKMNMLMNTHIEKEERIKKLKEELKSLGESV
jgi:hypothetical protein